MNFPVIDIKTLFVVGFYCFGIQSIANTFILIGGWKYNNFFGISSSLAGIIFSIVLCGFFYYSYNNMKGSGVDVSNITTPVEVDDDTMNIIKELKNR